MNTNVINGIGVTLALGLATAGAVLPGHQSNIRATAAATRAETLAGNNAATLTDARGTRVASAEYSRIVSVNTVADHLLLQLVEPERLVGVTHHSREAHPESWRFGTRASVERANDVEHILALKPDIVITSSFADQTVIARLQESDIPVFDLGDTRGVSAMRLSVLSLGGLLKVNDRAKQLIERTDRELTALRHAVPSDQRREGMYLSIYGDGFFGGTTRTSFDDMLDFAGIDDIAAKHGYVEWPQYTPEQLLSMNPALIITPEGMGAAICGHSILHALMACSPDGQIVEVSTEYISDPGLGLIHAAASIQLAVHPKRRVER